MNTFEELCRKADEYYGLNLSGCKNADEAIYSLKEALSELLGDRKNFSVEIDAIENVIGWFEDTLDDASYSLSTCDDKTACNCDESLSNPGHMANCPRGEADEMEHYFLHLLGEFCLYTQDKNKDQFNRACDVANLCVEKYTEWNTLRAKKEK